jgi:hypothetical protein
VREPPEAPKKRIRTRIVFQRERFIDIVTDLGPLFRRHDTELWPRREWGPLCPDIVRYLTLDAGNALLLITARAGLRLIGYSVDILAPDLHYAKTKQAQNDLIWLHPDFRTGRGLSISKQPGYRLLEEREKMLDELGIVRRRINVKIWKDFGPLLKKLGYTPELIGWQRVIIET